MNYPLIFSMLAILISGGSLAWTIRRDLSMRPRLKVNISYGRFIEGPGLTLLHSTPDRITQDSFIVVQAVNMGAMKIKVTRAHSTIKKGLFGKEYGFVVIDPLNKSVPGDRIPKVLESGDTLEILLPFDIKNEQGLLDPSEKVLKFGLEDSWGKIHYVPRHRLRLVRKTYAKMLYDNAFREPKKNKWKS